MDGELRETWLTDHALPQPAREFSATRLVWTSKSHETRLWIDCIPGGGEWMDLGAFSSALRSANLFDNRSIELPGAVIALPDGMLLLHQFFRVVRDHYRSVGLTEFDYPCLAPLSSLDAFDRVFPTKERVLFAATERELAAQSARALLLPTGEPIIYSHWKKLVRQACDLPIEMFRQTRFYRPWSTKKTGRGIFNTLDGADTFEFHCCYKATDAPEGAVRLFAMLRRLTDAINVPVLWSTRPPWSNYQAVSHASIGGDTPLPSGACLQVATLYNQGDIFSSQFGIAYRDENGQNKTPHHIVGALSRRLLIAHLLFGMSSDGTFIVHPEISPSQVHVVVRATELDTTESAHGFLRKLEASGIRVTVTFAASAHVVAKVLRRNARLLPPLFVLLQGRRSTDDTVREILIRSDDDSQCHLTLRDFAELSPESVVDAVRDVTNAFAERIRRYLTRRCVVSTTADEALSLLRERQVVIAPMRFCGDTVEAVHRWSTGEVLGFTRSREPGICIFSRLPTTTTAYISPRA
jgi:hypothetical protein